MAGAMDPRAQLIAQMAQQRGVDPAAVLSIASVEGGFNGAVGDNGTSFGPFQLHMNGALPSQYNGNAQAANQFANSQAGIGYALDAIAKVAKGKTGTDAISAISRMFERPADPAAEISKASGRYGQFAGGQGGQFTTLPYQPPGGGGGGVAPAQIPGLQQQPFHPGAGGGTSMIQELARTLLSQQAPQITPIGQQQAQPQGGGISRSSGIVQLQPQQENPLMQLAMSRMGAQAAHDTFGATPSAGTAVTGPPAQGVQGGIVKTAMSQLGIPYQWGGKAVLGGHTDCSGLAQAVFRANGIDIPRTTYEQWKAGTPVKPGQMQPGDLVFFHMGSSGPNHVGIYSGNGQFIEDPHTGSAVKTMSLSNYPGFVGARRFT